MVFHKICNFLTIDKNIMNWSDTIKYVDDNYYLICIVYCIQSVFDMLN